MLVKKVSKFSILYIIAGPPGVGKSTIGQVFVPSHVNVLNHDDIEAEYKKMGIEAYQIPLPTWILKNFPEIVF
jgi:predicted ABC-type ATPase